MPRSRSSLDGKPKKGGLLSSLVGDTVGSLLASEAEGLGASQSGEEEDPEQLKALSDEKIISHFKDRLPNEEWVLGVTCSHKRRGIYCQGMLYLTTKRLLFISPLLRRNVLLHLDLIRGLRKQKTARVLSNAISVSTKEKDLIFSSFIKRDKVWRLLYLAWQREVNPSVAPSLDEEDVELEQYADGSDDTDSGIAGELNSDDEDGDPFAEDPEEQTDSQQQPSARPHTPPDFLLQQPSTSSSSSSSNYLSLSPLPKRKTPSPSPTLALSAPLTPSGPATATGSGSDNEDLHVRESTSGSLTAIFKKGKSRRSKSELKRMSMKVRLPKTNRGTLPPMPKPLASSNLANSTTSLDLGGLSPSANNKAMILTYVPASPSLLYSTFFTESSAASEHWQRILKNNPFGRVTTITRWDETAPQQSQRRLSFESDIADGGAPQISRQTQSVSLSTEELCFTVTHEGSYSFSTTLRCTYRTHNFSKVSVELTGSARLEPVSEWLSTCIGIMHKIFTVPVVRARRHAKKLRTVPVKAENSTSVSPMPSTPAPQQRTQQLSLLKSITSEPLSLAICVILLVLILYSFYQIIMLRWLVSSLGELNRLAQTAIEQSLIQPVSILTPAK